MGKIGRNDPCPCGSGKKYKKCCLERDVTPLFTGTNNQPEPSAGSESVSVIRKLLQFASTEEFAMDKDIGMTLFWGGRLANRSDDEIRRVEEVGEQCEINFNTWFLFDMDVEDGKTVADIFLERERSRLPPYELSHLKKVMKTHLRLYEVLQVDMDRGFLLKDLWTGESYQVQEKSATHCFAQWDLMATRLMNEKDDIWVLEGAAFNFPARAKTFLLKELKSEYKLFQRQFPGKDDTAFFKRTGMMFNHWWIDWVVFPPLPTMVTHDGDPVLFTKAVFTVRDPAQLRSAIEQHPDMERIEADHYTWREKTSEGYRSLAALTFRKDRVVIETLSNERSERCRKILEEIAGDSIAYRLSEHQEPSQAIKYPPRKESKKKEEIPEEVQASIMKTFLDKRYRDWLEEEIPALSNRTPRHAVKLKTFRPKVINLLKEMENMEAHAARRGKIPYDFGWLWKELGLERERNNPF
ncbi:MAG: SEC-C domain-containing protein [Nitrospirae bacterium]|nr:SEC-C domain-containing protein [Nitrospirota bacterium]